MTILVAIAPWLILVYASLVAAGGIIGYVKAQSKASLSSGLVSGTALAIAGWLMIQRHYLAGLTLATCLAIALLIVFLLRFQKTDKFVPAGLMAVISLLITLVLVVECVSLILAALTVTS